MKPGHMRKLKAAAHRLAHEVKQKQEFVADPKDCDGKVLIYGSTTADEIMADYHERCSNASDEMVSVLREAGFLKGA